MVSQPYPYYLIDPWAKDDHSRACDKVEASEMPLTHQGKIVNHQQWHIPRDTEIRATLNGVKRCMICGLQHLFI